MRAALVSVLLLTAVLTAGCGAVKVISATSGDPSSGKKLFVANCGSCHTLADAGTKGTVGPNLDYAFCSVRKQGFEQSTIRNVIRGQIAYAETHTATGGPGMPDNLVTGQQAKDVAVYVSSVAGTGPGAVSCTATG